MTWGTSSWGTTPWGVRGFAALPSPAAFTAATQDSECDAVFLVEMLPRTGATATVAYKPLTWGTYAWGTLPYSLPADPSIRIDWSDRDWTSRPDDTRANIHFEGRAEAPQFDRSIPIVPGSGRAAVSIGELIGVNADGAYDTYPDAYAVDATPVRVLALPKRSSLYSEAAVVFSGQGLDWWADSSLHVRMRDSGYLLDVPLCALYGGTGGIDGGTELAGKVIRQTYGLCRNITGDLINSSLLIYRGHDRLAQAVDAVYISGVPLTWDGATYSSYAALAAASVPSGQYTKWLGSDGSGWRLGSSPGGTVTADVRGDAVGGYVSDTAGVIRRLLERGVSTASLALSSFASMASYLPGTIGYHVSSQRNISAAATEVAIAAAAWWGDAGDGLFSVGRLAAPVGGGLAFGPEQIVDEVEPMALPDDIAPCIWRVDAGYRRNWTPLQGTDIAPVPSVPTEQRRQELAAQSRRSAVALIERQVRNQLAKPLVIESLFDAEADATALCNNLLTLYQQGRRYYRVPVGMSGYLPRLGDTISVTWPRWGLAGGKSLRVVGQRAQGRKVDLLCFG
ncbi:hypothetical protein D9623_33560 (plasmid) [Azospirillum brasilense]|uniref:Tail protein n=1 Tax=Azospirillum brasilense TaxID=192 RepID=A0A4D8QW82_AZOBR|nr:MULTISPECIES: hypothetical protein [Azospirillum]YP_001686889.1 hypothetical protein APCd_gp48 [Azospirillum phage Cd]MDW7555368.1 hypothetical protein [Azospirillum brasilense]MDW7595224.1 hypothetical protein [Azospirillum brasilense]MDW7630377.1 hypothetical protein [Azospirillum brasilense]MDX5949745.1 hypothetical protein [Azospirillum brasilense]OPH16876.1 hypothetical protein FE89_02650 [Azospirillum brasilense]